MRQLSYAVAVTLALAGTALAGDQVTTQAASDADFGQCKTYQWMTTGHEIANPITAQNTVAAIDAQLSAHGWSKASDGTCYVAYQVAEEAQRGADWSGMGGFGRFGGGMGNIQTYTIETGEIVVTVMDASKKVIWMGSGKGTVNSDPNKAQKNIDKDIKKMFEKFPTGN
jgi:hypothetical protein